MIYTFYSFKGGVGRSMAMAGVAYHFAQRGLKVLAIDFDLEAPGLERYFFDGERCKSVRAQPGLMDLILDYRSALSSAALYEKGDFKIWKNYCTPAIYSTGPTQGSVDLMTAGRREPESALRNYALAVRSFDWQDFFYNAKGNLFFDWLRRRLLEPEGGYDVVLVDSRTGVTEMGGVCAYQLADVAVLLCAANFQNLEGTRDVARDFRSESVRALRLGRPLEIVAVPARIESEHPRRAEFLARFKEELGIDGLPMELAKVGLDYEALAIPYLPAFSVAERLVGEPPPSEEGSSPPVDAFERLADALTLLASEQSRLYELRGAAKARLTGAAATDSVALIADTTRSSAGYDAFIDCVREDLEVATQIVSALEQAGQRIFLDNTSLSAAVDFQTSVEHALEYSQTVLVIFGEPTQSRDRARLVARARRQRSTRVVPVLLPGCDPRVLASLDLSELQALDLRDWPAPSARAHLIESIAGFSRQGGRSAKSVVAPVETAPYVGHRAYGEDDAAYYFGREGECKQLVALLEKHELVVLTGPVKVGKSSLLHAGVLPILRGLMTEAGQARFARIEALDLLIDGDEDAEREAATRASLMILDHLDSFAHGADEAARASRFDRLMRLLQAVGSECRLIIVARDVLAATERDALMAAVTEALAPRRLAHMHIPPMPRDALQRAIETPAARAGHLLEPGLSERLMEGVGTAKNAIAQIQLALFAIWDERKRGWLTNRSLDALGHLDGLAEARLRAIVKALEPHQVESARALMMRLVTLSGRRELVPTPQSWEPLATVPVIAAGGALDIRDRLADACLLDVYRDRAVADAPDEAPSVQVALARTNASLYVDGTRADINLKFLLWRDAVAPLLRLWRDGKDDALLRAATLIEAEQWLDSQPRWLTTPESEFLMASLAAREQRSKRKREQQDAVHIEREGRERERRLAAEEYSRKLKARSAFIGVALFVAVVMWVDAYYARNEEAALRVFAEEQRALASDEAQKAKDEAQKAKAGMASAILALDELSKSQLAQDRILNSARELNTASLAVLSAADSSSRLAASSQLAITRDAFIATTDAASRGKADCPAGRRLYLHIVDEADRPWARELIPKLEKANFIVPGIELKTVRLKSSDVRYFRPADRTGADDAIAVLRGAGLTDVRVNFISGYEPSTSIRACHYEAWFAVRAITIRYFRDSDQQMVELIAKNLKLKVDRGIAEAYSATNLMAFSQDIAPAERTEIAVALLEAGLQLREISPALKAKSGRLVQVIYSQRTSQECGPLTLTEVRAGKTCGDK